MKSDYLKYWRVIRYYVKAQYGLTTAELEMLLFLYSEGYFDKAKFNDFNQIISWDDKRFSKMLSEGWITYFRQPKRNIKAIYELSYKSKRMIDTIYKKLEGEELSISEEHSPLFKRRVKYTDKVYRNMIMKMREATRQQQRLAPESQSDAPH
jgi:hypothetical protein